MKKLAIISSYNESCGNASYTHVLKNSFAKYVTVEVISLDLFLLQSKQSSLRKAGDEHIRDICARLSEFDYVNVQFEAGLFGRETNDIFRRTKWIIDSAPNITLTLHRVETDGDNIIQAVKAGIAARRMKRFRQKRGAAKHTRLTKAIVQYCRETARRKNVQLKVHTRRDRRMVESVFRNPNVYDYPIVFLTGEERDTAWQQADRQAFLDKYGFDNKDKVVGLFGFLSAYKGVDTAIQALSLLPREYKLGLFGSQHPQSVKRNETLDPYLKALFELMDDIDSTDYIARSLRDIYDPTGSNRAPDKQSGLTDELLRRFVETSNRANTTVPVTERVRFIGGLPDPEFIEALRLCDAVVLPYIETGQGMSGVIVLSLEAGSKMICANNISFRETSRYFSDCYLNFDIGNYHELARKVVWTVDNQEEAACKAARDKAFQTYNIDASVRLQLEKFGHSFA